MHDFPPDSSLLQQKPWLLLEHCLPVTEAARLLPELARCWSQLFPACTVTVLAVEHGRRHLRLARLEPDGTPLLRDLVSIDPPSLTGSPDELQQLIRRYCECSPTASHQAEAPVRAAHSATEGSQGTSCRLIPLIHHEQPVGAILLEVARAAEQSAARTDELARLTAALLAQLHALDQRPAAEEFARQLEAQRLESLAEFAAGAGHEINNPATTIAGRARLLLEQEADPARRQSLETIGAEALRIRDMIGDTMVFGRPPAPRLEPVAAVPALQQMIQRFGEPLRETGGTIPLEVASGSEILQLLADPAQFEIATGAVLSNAIHAVRNQHQLAGGSLQPIIVKLDREPAAGHSESLSTACGIITISDRGTGLSENEARHLFDPFYSGRQAGRGLGFGLSRAWRIVRAHGGTIELASSREPTVLVIRWPLAAPTG